MSHNNESPLKLTEFAPIDDEEKQPTVGQYISNFFSKFTRSTTVTDNSPSPSESKSSEDKDDISNQSSTLEAIEEKPQIPVNSLSEGRSLPSVLKRISNLLATKNTSLQAYSDTELRQYWMPDSVAKECFECSEKFTTWRRRHHCRLCGQIFCSRCCSQEIPGKLMGCTGDLRVCMYCCKVVLSYLPTSNVGSEMTADIQVLLENLQTKYGSTNFVNNSDTQSISSSVTTGSNTNLNVINTENENSTTQARRKISVGYQEEKFAIGRPTSKNSAITEERCRALQSSTSLRKIYEEVVSNTYSLGSNQIPSSHSNERKLMLSIHRVRLKTYHQCFPGSQLVDWLINHNQAKSRVQAAVIGQALLEAGYLENVLESPAASSTAINSSFSDSPTNFYRPCPPSELTFELPTLSSSNESRDDDKCHKSRNEPAEPTWVQQIPQDGGTTTDSEAESHASPPAMPTGSRIPSSSSSFYLDLDLAASTVHLVRPFNSDDGTSPTNPPADLLPINDSKDVPVLQSSVKEEVPPESGWYNTKQLREETGEAEAYRILNEVWTRHESALLAQFLNNEGLSLSWSNTVLSLIKEVVEFVRPDMYHNADIIDSREYVRVKTVSGGSRNDCYVVHGVVCSKNVAHKSMQSQKIQPKILLLTCPLVYQRNEGKYMALEPVWLQEHEHLRHATARILAMKPNIVLVARNASRLAQELLGEAGVALATNVKTSVIDRIARASGADVVHNIDAANVGRRSWRLATCQEFYTKKFKEDEHSSKTLMFFEGLPASHLACTVILRGAAKMELRKLKRVTLKMVFARYNWRLEHSFLMDEFAKPPRTDYSFFDGSKENSPDNQISNHAIIKTLDNNFKSKDPNQNKLIEDLSNVFQTAHLNQKQDEEISVTTKCKSENDNEHKCTKNCEDIKISITSPAEINDNSKRPCSKTNVICDPLQFYEEGDDGSNSSSQQLSMREIPLSNRFRKALDGTILSYSPYFTFTIPFLETEIGRRCKLRKFFPKEIYYSRQFLEHDDKRLLDQKPVFHYKKEQNNNIYQLKPEHQFVKAKITSSAQNEDIQAMLSNFRACGGRLNYPERNFVSCNKYVQRQILANNEELKSSEGDLKPTQQSPFIDVLLLENHQRLAVLFCSFSAESNNAPAFCVDPCTKEMYFYGVMDAALGNFLEQYCFRDTYRCISENCVTPSLKHTRRYVHHNGCVTLKLNYLDPPIASDQILMWNWCTKCNTVSPVVPMSTDTWSFSFAKFLEYKVHGYMYGRRGKEETCTHSLHHDHVHYFGFGNIAASFQYTPVELLELSIPSPKIEIKYNTTVQQENYIDEIKVLALRGHEVYSSILEKLLQLPADLNELPDLKQLLNQNQSTFKSKIEEVQIKLTSPTLENKKMCTSSRTSLVASLWHLEDSIVIIKRLIAEVCESWNVRLSDIIQTQTQKTRTSSISRQSRPLSAQDMPLNRSSLAAPLEDVDVEPSTVETPTTPDYNVVDVVNQSIESVTEDELSKNDVNSSNSNDVFIESEERLPEHDNKSDNNGCHEDIPHSESRRDTPPAVQDKDKKTVKTLITQFLTSSTATTPISNPFSFLEHHLLPIGRNIPLTVYENEPSSIIAYALTTQEYKRTMDELCRNKTVRNSLNITQKSELSSSPINKRKTLNDNDSEDSGNNETVSNKPETNAENKSKQANQNSQHIDIQFQDNKTNFMVRIHYAEHFAKLREAVLSKDDNLSTSCSIDNSSEFEEYEETYIRSLSRSVQWTARGGKSGSFFCKTKDDRFILKEMSTQEMDKFLVFAPNYFDYVNNCITTSQPTLLGKIIGVYRVCYKNATNGEKKNFLVMENLFYERRVTHKFDLKGSVRNRHVNADDQDSEIVLLDENLLKMTCKSPLYIYPHSKTVLTTAIMSDTEFLAAQSVMDYSLLVGLDPHTKELVVGIIDYIRTFTWDKKIETIVKKSGLLGGQGKLPTIISPDEYKNRFITAMHRYFLPVPGRWYGLNIK